MLKTHAVGCGAQMESARGELRAGKLNNARGELRAGKLKTHAVD